MFIIMLPSGHLDRIDLVKIVLPVFTEVTVYRSYCFLFTEDWFLFSSSIRAYIELETYVAAPIRVYVETLSYFCRYLKGIL